MVRLRIGDMSELNGAAIVLVVLPWPVPALVLGVEGLGLMLAKIVKKIGGAK